MANNGKGNSEEDRSYRDHRGKKTILELLNETLQWFIFGGLLFRKSGSPPAGPSGEAQIEVPQIPSWLVTKFHLLTKEDEQEWDQILDSFDESPAQQKIFFKFKNGIVNEGYDEDHLRLMLVNLNRDWLNRKDAKKTEIPNSAIIFIKQIIALDGDYEAQKELADEKKFLQRVGPLKRAYLWHTSHILETIVGFFLIPWAMYQFIIWLLGA